MEAFSVVSFVHYFYDIVTSTVSAKVENLTKTDY